MKILLINRYNTNTGLYDSVSLNLRYTLPLSFYRKKGLINHNIIVLHESNDALSLAIRWADKIVVNRSTSRKLLSLIQKDSWEKLIYDIDDNIFINVSYARNLNHNVDISIYDEFINRAGMVTVSNCELWTVINKKYDLKNLKILPISIHPEKKPNFISGNKILMVNGDSIKMLNDKKRFISELNIFIHKNPSVQLDYIGDLSDDVYKIKNLNYIEKMPYSSLRKFLKKNLYKCSLIPLSGDKSFNDCKSAIKYYQCGIFGVPGIYSNELVYSKVIDNNENGLLVDGSDNSWLSALENIYESDFLRCSIAKRSYENVKNNHTFESFFGIYMEIFS